MLEDIKFAYFKIMNYNVPNKQIKLVCLLIFEFKFWLDFTVPTFEDLLSDYVTEKLSRPINTNLMQIMH